MAASFFEVQEHISQDLKFMPVCPKGIKSGPVEGPQEGDCSLVKTETTVKTSKRADASAGRSRWVLLNMHMAFTRPVLWNISDIMKMVEIFNCFQTSLGTVLFILWWCGGCMNQWRKTHFVINIVEFSSWLRYKYNQTESKVYFTPNSQHTCEQWMARMCVFGECSGLHWSQRLRFSLLFFHLSPHYVFMT